MVSQSRRWDAKHDVVQRVVTGGKIGDLTTINCDFYIGAHFGGFRDKMPSPLILDMAIHHFDLLRMEKHRLKDSSPATPAMSLIFALDRQLDRILAEAAGNNLARWLTSMPPVSATPPRTRST